MPTYVWKGKNRYGDTVGGERVAASKEEVGRLLQKDQITVFSVAPAKGGFSIPFLKREKVRRKDRAIYSRQLSVLIDAELPLIQSLGILEEQQKNTYFKKVIKTIKDDVEAGSTLNQAKRQHPKAFVVSVFLLWKVIPVFASIFRDLGAELPFLTAFVVGMSDFVEKNILFVAIGLVALVFLFRYYRSTKHGHWTTDRLILKMPLFGPLLFKVSMTRVTRTLATLISGGVPMLEDLRSTSTTAGNA